MSPSRRLIIDANVARSAGETEDWTSTSCRAFLQDVLAICHRVVMNGSLHREWRSQATRFSTRWLTEMASRGKLVTVDSSAAEEALSERLSTLPQNSRVPLLKDAHLAAAAKKTDGCIVSRDDNARRHFKAAAKTIPGLSELVWVNPTSSSENAPGWLAAGAPSDPHRMLGAAGPLNARR